MPIYRLIGGSFDGTDITYEPAITPGQVVQMPSRVGSNASESYQLQSDGSLYAVGYGDKPFVVSENIEETKAVLSRIQQILKTIRDPLAELTDLLDRHGYPPPFLVGNWLLTHVQKPPKNEESQT